MAECTGCGKKIRWFVDGGSDICTPCRNANFALKQSKKAQASERQVSKSNKQSRPTASEGSTPAATAFTSLAWVIVALTFICTLIATFVTAADGDAFLAMIMFISGCFSAVLLGLLTEISANIAKLVNNSR